MLPAAVDVILETGQASVSMLQRRLKLGYARAARIVDEMEEKGIVGPFQGSKPRTILVTKEQWEAMKSVQPQQMGFDDMDDDFGLLPLPKYTVEQETYHTTAQDAYNAMSVMRNAKNMEMIGAALELLSAESWRTVRPQLCESSFKFRYMRDSESGQIFDIIVDGITFDHAILYSTAINNAGWLIRDELNNNRNNLSSSLRAYTKMYNRSLEKLNAYFLDRGAE